MSSNIFNVEQPKPGANRHENVADNLNDQQLLDNLRERLAKRGSRGIASIGRKFKIADDDRSG